MLARHSYRLVSAAILLTTWSAISSAQTTARVNGAITDTSNTVIPSVRITVTSVDTGIKREAASHTWGFYEVTLLPPGNYNITAQKEGFRQTAREGIRLEVNQVARIDFALQLGAVSE